MKFDLVIFKCMCNFQTKTWEITGGYLNRDEGGVVEETRNVEDDTTKLETEVYRLEQKRMQSQVICRVIRAYFHESVVNFTHS